MVITFPAYDKEGKECLISTNDFSLKIIEEGKETLVTELFDIHRAQAIIEYLVKDAGIKPISHPVFLVEKQDWPQILKNVGGQVRYESMIIDNHEYFYPVVMIQKTKGDYSDENLVFAHEILGHLGFDHYIYPEKRRFFHPLSEAFARTIDMFLNSYREEIISDSYGYSGNTHDFVKKSLMLYPKIGKRAIVSLFYASNPEESPSLLERVYLEKEVVHAIAVLATEYHERTLEHMLTQPFEEILKKAKQVRRDYSERDLMLAHLTEFSFGETFSQAYLRDLKPSSLEELIEDKNIALLDNASALKWQYAHAGTSVPLHARGMQLFDHIISTVEHITDIIGEYSPWSYIPRMFEMYTPYFGRGDHLVHNFIKYDLTYDDTRVLIPYDVSFIIAKRKLFSFLRSHLQAAKGFLYPKH